MAHSVTTSCRVPALSIFLPGPKHVCHLPVCVKRKHIPSLNYESLLLLDFKLIKVFRIVF